MRVLVFDDEDYKSRLVKAWLDNENIECEVDVVTKKEDFLKKINSKYDYFLVDYFLDGSSTGDDIAKLYGERHPTCDIVVYSSFSNFLDDASEFKKINFENLHKYIKDNIKSNGRVSSPSYQIYEIKEIKKDIQNQGTRIETLFEIIGKQESRVNSVCEAVSKHDVLLVTMKESSTRLETKVDLVVESIAASDKTLMSRFSWLSGILITLVGLGFGFITWYISHLIGLVVKP